MMEDREKVVQGLEYCAAEDKKCFDRRECPYFEAWPMCSHLLVKDALALMKAEEPIRADVVDADGGRTRWFVCAFCKTPIMHMDRYCHECGKPVIWK